MFTYEYLKSNDIFNNTILIKNFNTNELAILAGLIIIFSISVYFIFPIFYTFYKYIQNILDKKRKKYLLKQIALEKEIEEQIHKEMEQH